uniref:Uncharacterized protein n=1 Tax=Rhizophagus irregularis (strain DAOM 181602 / DAOM 197198 / MUCL 43194) TaxID=747089 RepID=U9SK34_RHIID
MNDLSEFDQENVRNLIINIQRKDCQKIPDLKDLYDLTKSLIGGLKKNEVCLELEVGFINLSLGLSITDLRVNLSLDISLKYQQI